MSGRVPVPPGNVEETGVAPGIDVLRMVTKTLPPAGIFVVDAVIEYVKPVMPVNVFVALSVIAPLGPVTEMATCGLGGTAVVAEVEPKVLLPPLEPPGLLQAKELMHRTPAAIRYFVFIVDPLVFSETPKLRMKPTCRCHSMI